MKVIIRYGNIETDLGDVTISIVPDNQPEKWLKFHAKGGYIVFDESFIENKSLGFEVDMRTHVKTLEVIWDKDKLDE